LGKINDKIEIIWEDTNHEWNIFGEKIDEELIKTEYQKELEAKAIAIWRKVSLEEFIKKVIESIIAILELRNSNTIIEDFISAIILLNLIPLDIKIVFNDNEANLFLDMLKYENGEDFIYKKDLIKYEKDLKRIIEYFKDKNLIEERDDKYIIKGSVLNKVFIKSEN